jgi:hypothetical protein
LKKNEDVERNEDFGKEEGVRMMNHAAKAIKIALCVTAAVLVFGFIVKGLWNVLIPPIFGWHTITFWQAFGLLALCRILFGGHGWQRHGHSHFRDRMRFKEKMRGRCGRMTSEERERFRQAMRERWDFGSAASADASESKGQ